jgi:hypothetical protein
MRSDQCQENDFLTFGAFGQECINRQCFDEPGTLVPQLIAAHHPYKMSLTVSYLRWSIAPAICLW